MFGNNTDVLRFCATLRSLAGGVVLGIDQLIMAIALASLIYSNALSVVVDQGVLLFLLVDLSALVVVIFWGPFKNSIALAQDTTIPLLLPAVTLAVTAAAESVIHAPSVLLVQFATTIAVLGTVTICSSCLFAVCGIFKLGSVVRMLPYPVLIGFMAGTGWLFIFTAFSLLTASSSFSEVTALSQTLQGGVRILPAVLLALSLMLLVYVWKKPGGIVLFLLVATGLFYLGLVTLGISLADARELGLTVAGPRDINNSTHSTLVPQLGLTLYTYVHWPSVWLVAPTIVAAACLNVVGMLLNLSSAETLLRKDIDINRSLRVAALQNIIVGGVGGPTAFIAIGNSIAAVKLQAQGRSLYLALGTIIVLGCFMAKSIVAVVPLFVPCGFLIFMGGSLLLDCLVKSRALLATSEQLIVILMLAITIVVGFLEAIAFGAIASALVFVMSYARKSTFRYVKKDVVQSTQVDSTEIVSLQGYLFFGSSQQIISLVRQRLGGAPVLRNLIVDMQFVTGLDASACLVFLQIYRLADSEGFTLYLCQASPTEQSRLASAGSPLHHISSDHVVDHLCWNVVESLDHAILLCEQDLLCGWLSNEPGEFSQKKEFKQKAMPQKLTRLSTTMKATIDNPNYSRRCDIWLDY